MRNGDERLANELLKSDLFASCERVITWQNHKQWLLDNKPVLQVRYVWLRPHECEVEIAFHQRIAKRRRVLAGDRNLNLRKFVAENPHRLRQPLYLLPSKEPKRKYGL